MADDLAAYDFSLPPALVAQHPSKRRGGGRLLTAGDNRIRRFSELPNLLRRGDLLVVNDSRVLPARLEGEKESGGRAEILLERIVGDNDCVAQVGASKPPRPGSRIRAGGGDFLVLGREGAFYRLRAVAPGGAAAAVKRRFLRAGKIPLPPYIRRPPAAADKDRYQTIFARRSGSVAAPTAGLHFTDATLRAAARRGAGLARITLHVGAGTFSPIRGAVENHVMHRERYVIGAGAAAAIRSAKKRGGRIVAVGTTVLRALESAARQNGGAARQTRAETDLFIRPGFQFRVADALLTNFHLPRSSLLLLVCAFGGRERILAAYRHAIANGMRFYSYGDAMLAER